MEIEIFALAKKIRTNQNILPNNQTLSDAE